MTTSRRCHQGQYALKATRRRPSGDLSDPVDSMRRRREYVQQILGLATDCVDLVERVLAVMAGARQIRRGQAECLDPEGVYTSKEVARILKVNPTDLDLLAQDLQIPSLAVPGGGRRFLGRHLLDFMDGADRAPEPTPRLAVLEQTSAVEPPASYWIEAAEGEAEEEEEDA